MTYYNKLKWALGIVMVFAIIIATNLIDRNNFIQVKESVKTIYEDRLIANDLIFEISKSVQEKEIAVRLEDSTFFNQQNNKINTDIKNFIGRFEETKLIEEESIIFDSLKNNFESLKNSEKTLLKSSFNTKYDLLNHISNLKENIYDLSKIQLVEGKNQMNISNKAINSTELFTQMEIYILIVLAILIQLVVISKPKEK